jgi:hypothetical protein
MTTPSRAIKTFDNPSEALRSHIDDLKSRTDIPSVPEGHDLRIDKYDDNRTDFKVFALAEYAKKPDREDTTNLSYTNRLLYKHIRTMESASELIDAFHKVLTKTTTVDTGGFFTYHDQVAHEIYHMVYRMPRALADISYHSHSDSVVVLSIHDDYNRYKIYVEVDELLAIAILGREPKASLRKGYEGNWERFVGKEPIGNYTKVPLSKILKAPFIAKTLKTIGTEYEEVTIQQVQKEFNTIHEKVTANIFEGVAKRLQLGRAEYDELIQIKVAYDDCWDRLAELCGMIKRIRRGEEEGEGEEDGEDEPLKKKKRC